MVLTLDLSDIDPSGGWLRVLVRVDCGDDGAGTGVDEVEATASSTGFLGVDSEAGLGC